MSNPKPEIPSYWLPTSADQPTAHRRYRVLVGKVGLDGHDRGAKYVAHVLRDAGFEVIYTGIRRTPEQIVAAAIQEDVDGIGLSLLSGAHNTLFARVLQLLAERGAAEIAVFGGGVIPAEDVEHLLSIGVKAIFTPGTSADELVGQITAILGEGVAR